MKLQNKTVAFIGAGNMGEALIRGLLAAKTVDPSQIIVADIRAERRDFLARGFGVRAVSDNAAAVKSADIIVLAVKPQQMNEVLVALAPVANGAKLFISIAAGITTARIERGLGGQARVIRTMPNTPALVGAGAAALAKGSHATDEDIAMAESILGAVGVTVRVDEARLAAVTALSGSGPAYVFHVAEAMIKAGVAVGLDEGLARKLAIQTIYGAAKLMAESGEAPAELRRKVTSPGGTTEAALNVLNERKLEEAFAEAIRAAEKRSRELSTA
jgi:pyrroline-5-carboxylate reductase